MKYKIWSHYHSQWWKPAEAGYTSKVDEAGLYSAHDAMRIAIYSLRNTVMNEVAADKMIGLGHELVEAEILKLRKR